MRPPRVRHAVARCRKRNTVPLLLQLIVMLPCGYVGRAMVVVALYDTVSLVVMLSTVDCYVVVVVVRL